MKIKLLVLNFIAVFVVAFALTTFFHEFAHAVVAKVLHVYPVLFHSYVSYDNTGVLAVHQLYIAVVGPLVSFSQAVFFLILLRLKFRFDLLGLLFLWLAIMGMVVVCGYVIMGPFVPYGDTGKIYEILPIPKIATYLFSVGALFVLIYFFRRITPKFTGFLYQLKKENGYSTQKTLRLFIGIPVIMGTIINVLFSLPAPTLMSLAFPIVITLTIIPTIISLKNSGLATYGNSFLENNFVNKSYWPIFLMILLIILSRILSVGITV